MARAKGGRRPRKKGVHLFSDEQQENEEKAQRRRERDAKRAEKKAQIVARQEDRLKKSCQGDHSEDAQVPVCQGGSKWVSCDKCDSFYLCKKHAAPGLGLLEKHKKSKTPPHKRPRMLVFTEHRVNQRHK